MIITNKFNLPEPYYKACCRDSHPRFDMSTFSVTEMLKGNKEIILTRRHWNELTRDCSEMYWMVMGTATHKVFEGHASEDEFAEERISIPVNVNGITFYISGGFDLYNALTLTITDYKNTKVFGYQMKLAEGSSSDWFKQLQSYWWLLGKAGFEVRHGRIFAGLTDWSLQTAKRDPKYPQSQVAVVDYTFGDTEAAMEVEKDFARKIESIIADDLMPDDAISPCTKEERWERDECWAVMKKGRKTAVKRCYTPSEADAKVAELGMGHYVEYRPGTPVKCIDYCVCKDHCSFYRNYMANANVEDAEVVA